MRLARSDKACHDNVVDLSPVLAGACGNVRDDVGVRFPVQTWLVADGAFANFHNVLLTLIVCEVILFEEFAMLSFGTQWFCLYRRDDRRLGLVVERSA